MAKVVVELLEAKNLISKDLSGAYCDVSILGTSMSKKSKTVKGSLSPAWNEIFTFDKVDITNKETNTLCIEVMDHDLITKDDQIGIAHIALETLKDGKTYHVWLKLKDGKGEVRVRLTVTRSHGTLSMQSQLEKEIIEYCKKNNCKFEDKEFPAGDFSIYKSGKGPHTSRVQWKRPSEFAKNPRLFVDGIEAGDVIQGSLGDCYFLGALSVVATRKDLLEPLIVSAHPEYGFYQVKFFKNSEWQVVTIDDKIPCIGNTPIYSRCKDTDEIWVPLMEKAYAKLHRCYEALESGSIANALADLTGESTQTYTFDDPAVKNTIANGSLWKELEYFVAESFLMGCSFNDDGAAETDTGMGILKNHAYGLLDAKAAKAKRENLLCVRNPWGRMEWTGRYSDNASDWTPELMKELNVTFADDGTFWMNMEDYVRQYNQMIVLRLLNDEIGKVWQKRMYKGEWKGRTAGGSTNNPTWRNNPQYGIVVKVPDTKVFIALSQPDQRLNWTTDYKFPIGIHLLKTTNSQNQKLQCQKDDVVTKCNHIPGRDASISATLPVGEYVVFPSTFSPGMETNYWLTIYSEEAMDVFPIPEESEIGIKSEWKGGLAGGCFNHKTWVNNPKFLVTPTGSHPSGPVHVAFMLRQPERKPLYYMGLYTGKWSGQQVDKNMCKGSKPCLNAREILFETFIQSSDWPQYVIPHTFEAGQESDFELYVQSSIPLKIEKLDV